MSEPLYPEIEVELSGEDGNIFSIMGKIQRAMRKNKVPNEEQKAFFNEVTSSDSYDQALQVCMKYVSVS